VLELSEYGGSITTRFSPPIRDFFAAAAIVMLPLTCKVATCQADISHRPASKTMKALSRILLPCCHRPNLFRLSFRTPLPSGSRNQSRGLNNVGVYYGAPSLREKSGVGSRSLDERRLA
jgi:hypothetical protein